MDENSDRKRAWDERYLAASDMVARSFILSANGEEPAQSVIDASRAAANRCNWRVKCGKVRKASSPIRHAAPAVAGTTRSSVSARNRETSEEDDADEDDVALFEWRFDLNGACADAGDSEVEDDF